MLHVNSREGYTIAVSEAKFLGRIAKRTVLSDSALSVVVPIYEDILNWNSAQILRDLRIAPSLTPGVGQDPN
jgi:hypothetical protein